MSEETTEYTGELPLLPDAEMLDTRAGHMPIFTEAQRNEYARAAVAHVLAQKTGDVKRYKENWGSHYLGEDANGEWVRFADVAAALAQSRQRVEELEAELAQARAGQGEAVLTPLDYRAQGREEALAIILAEDPEEPFNECTYNSPNADAGDYSAHWDEKKVCDLLHIGDAKHDAFGRAEAAYWESMALKEEAERMMRMVEAAPYFQPLHDFLAQHQQWNLLHDLQAATHPVPQQGQVPEGYKLVPINTVVEQVAAGLSADNNAHHVTDIYQAMIAAAPAQGEKK